MYLELCVAFIITAYCSNVYNRLLKLLSAIAKDVNSPSLLFLTPDLSEFVECGVASKGKKKGAKK